MVLTIRVRAKGKAGRGAGGRMQSSTNTCQRLIRTAGKYESVKPFDKLWGYVPLGALAVAYVVRTALEDRTLRKELRGYEYYCRLTRYRLLPGVW